VLRNDPGHQGDRAENQGRQRHSPELIGHQDEEKHDLRGEKELEKGEFPVVGGKAMLQARSPRLKSQEDQASHDHPGDGVAGSGREIESGEQGVKIVLPAGDHGDGVVIDYAPEQPFENEQPAESDDEGRDAFLHDERAHGAPDRQRDEQPGEQGRRRRPMVIGDQDRADASDQPHAAARAQIDVTWKDDQ